MKCLSPNCGEEAEIRGLCNECFQETNDLIEMGVCDEMDLEERGYLLSEIEWENYELFDV
jgi:NMD protein affecting ribosome stability and mRNA decay